MEVDEFGKPKVYKEEIKQKEDKKKYYCTPKEKHPSCVQNLKHYVWEFCSRTTVHGFTYLGERGRTIPERIWWLLTIVVALYLCISLIMQTYDKWMNSPVIVTFATSQTPIWKIPFPGVTICSEIKSRKSRFNYTDVYLKKKKKEQLTEKEIREFEYMSMVCDSPAELLNQSLTTTDENAIDFLMEVAPNFKKMMFKVLWRGRQYKDLTELLTPILTSEGLCYTFNAMDRSEIFTDAVATYKDCFSTNGKRSQWSVETGYDEDADLDAYPRRTVVQGLKGGFSVYLNVPKEDIDYACADSMQGFKVILHHPGEVPRGKTKYFRVPLDHSVTASVKPIMMSTAGELQNYKPKDRQCYFTRERSLKYFKIYNQHNCLNECLIDFTYKTCGCVGFHMQREKSMRICSASKLKCIVDARSIYTANEVKDELKHADQKHKSALSETSDGSLKKKCDCLPACNSLDFDVERSQAEWNWKAFLAIEEEAGEWHPEDDHPLNESHFARLTIFYKDMQFITSERNELYGQTDFFASCGGLLGLFTGFSFLSAVEILYYLTLRFFCNVCIFGRHYWSGSKELLDQEEESEESKSA